MIRFIDALWHVVGLLLLVLLFVEFGVDWIRRGLRRWRYGRVTKPGRAARAAAYAGAEWPIEYFDEFVGRVRVDFAPHVGWWQRPFRGSYVTIDERGLRVTPGTGETRPDAVRILCFGGSTMMGMGARDDQTIPAALARRLYDLGHAAAITNAGQLGHNSTQEAISLHRLLKQGERPDLVVLYDGINDMVCAEQTGLPDRVMHEASRRAEFNLLFSDRRKELIQAALITLLPRTTRRLRELTGLPLRGPIPGRGAGLANADLPVLARQVIEAYCANLRLVRLLGDAYGFRTLFFWQPVLTTKRVKSDDELFFESEFTGSVDLRRRFYDEVIAAYRNHPELSAAGDVIDLSRLFDESIEPLYVDLYHISEAGNAAVAEAMLPPIAASVAASRRSVLPSLAGTD